MALESGHVTKSKPGWYQKVDVETGEVLPKSYRLADTDTKEFWKPIISSQSFKSWVVDRYQLASSEILPDEEVDEVFSQLDDQ
jgi:hypothetical protein